MRRSTALMGVAILGHLAIGRWLPSPWLVPDLTLLSVAVLILRLPGHPLTPAWLAGVAAMTLAVHHPLLTGLAYVATGAAVKWIAHQWEIDEPLRERLAVGVAQGLLLMVLVLMSAGSVSLNLILMAGVQIGLTLLCLPLMRALVNRVVVPRPS